MTGQSTQGLSLSHRSKIGDHGVMMLGANSKVVYEIEREKKKTNTSRKRIGEHRHKINRGEELTIYERGTENQDQTTFTSENWDNAKSQHPRP